jgi:osmoprotectant transport system permease protein
MIRRFVCTAILLLGASSAMGQAVVIGSKMFPENYILAEIAAQLLEDRGFEVQRRLGMGGTKICYEALQTGAIDFYPEYTGTISEVILGQSEIRDLDDIRAALGERELRLLSPIGFNNISARVPESAGRLARSQSSVWSDAEC